MRLRRVFQVWSARGFSAMYWDGGHAVNFDSPALMAWIGQLTGYSAG